MQSMMKKFFIFSSAVVVLSSCAFPRHVPTFYDAGNPLKRVAVLPVKNDTDDVDGPSLVRKKMIEALEQKSYIIKDVKETDQILRDQMGINLGGQLDLTTPQKLGETLGVEGVLYGTLIDFDETTTGLLNVRKVRGKFRLVNTQTGQALWERGLGVRSETRMSGTSGKVASAVARAADAKEKDVPWVTIDSTATNERNVGQAFAVGLGVKLLSKAVGIHLEHESKEMVRRVTDTLPWGPGPGTAAPSPAVVAKFQAPKMKMLEPPSFGYMDYGKKDFSAVLVSVTVDKSSRETFNFNIPTAKAGNRMRMDIDMSAMSRGSQEMPPALSKISTIHLGDKKISYTLYPNSRKYMTHTPTEGSGSPQEKPLIQKKKVGSEIIDGHPTDKYKVTITYNNGRKEEEIFWNARDLDDMTIRSEVENKDSRVTTELKSILLKRPAAELFEIPAGYTEAQGFMDLMSDAKN